MIGAFGVAACGENTGGAQGPPIQKAAGETAPYLGLASAYVGDAACADCHAEAYDGYQSHGMAQSYYRLTPERAVEAFPSPAIAHESSGFVYRAFREDGRFYQEEYRLGPDGRKAHRLVREMAEVVGSGSAARTYLAVENGRRYQLPLTWYTQEDGGRWGFSPGYDVSNQRFDRLVPDRCMACHNGTPETAAFVPGKYESVPDGITCERCHGPGALHVEERLSSPGPISGTDYTIVDPADLSFERRMDVCQQCHLAGDVFLLREGRDAYDFRPGEDLADHLALYSAPHDETEFRVISHVDRMKDSACFEATLAAGNPMECTTCHDPHEGFRAKGPAYFDATCMDCHGAETLVASFTDPIQKELHAEGSGCFSCHMPKVVADDAPHASFTDHKIRVVREVADAPSALPKPLRAGDARLVPYFERDRAPTPEARRYEGLAEVIAGRQAGDGDEIARGIEDLRAGLAGDTAATSGSGEAHLQLGIALLERGDADEALPALERAVRLGPGVPERLNALAQAYEAAGRDASATKRLYREALRIAPARADIRVNYGRFLQARGQVDEALREYTAAAEEEPWLAEAHFNRGTALLQQGDREAAEASLNEALRLDPDDPDALGNLGLLRATGGDPDAARGFFERAVASAPKRGAQKHAVALGNLGTYWLNEGDEARARELFEQAVETDARYADGWANLALARFRLGDEAGALVAADEALAIRPQHALAQQIVGALR